MCNHVYRWMLCIPVDYYDLDRYYELILIDEVRLYYELLIYTSNDEYKYM